MDPYKERAGKVVEQGPGARGKRSQQPGFVAATVVAAVLVAFGRHRLHLIIKI